MSDTLIGALIGLTGIFLGLLGNEYFRRRNRIEDYAKEIFFKRLEVYEELIRRLNIASTIASNLNEEELTDPEGLADACDEIIMSTANFLDEKALYVNDEMVVQCMLTIMNLKSEVLLAESWEKRQAYLARFWSDSKETKSMIRTEAGLSELDKLFGKITRAKHNSEYVKYWREAKSKRTKT